MNHLFKVLPQHLNGVKTLTRPFYNLNSFFYESVRGGLGLRVIVLLHNPVVLVLQITD